MSTFRFALFAIGLSALTFLGISWGTKGFPVMTMRSEPAKLVAQTAHPQPAPTQAAQAPAVEEKKAVQPKPEAAQVATQAAARPQFRSRLSKRA